MGLKILFWGGRGWGFAQDMYDYVFKPMGAKQCRFGTPITRYLFETFVRDYDLIWCEEETIQSSGVYLLHYTAKTNGIFKRFYRSQKANIISRFHYADIENILRLSTWKAIMALTCCDQPVCVSEYSRRKLETLLPLYDGLKNLKIVHNGIDTNIYKPNPKLKQNNLVFYLAFTSIRKRLHLLIQAMKYLKDWNLIIGGGCRLHEDIDREDSSVPSECQKSKDYWIWCHQLSKPYKSRIRWTGILSTEDKIRIYQRSTVFCLPSMMEAWAVTVLEAMSCGTPGIACEVGGIPEFVPRPQLLSRDPTPKEIAEKIMEVSRHPEWSVLNRGIAENYDWKVVKEEVKAVINETLKQGLVLAANELV